MSVAELPRVQGLRRPTLPRPHTAGKPFTLPHFRAWARELTLDTGDPWTIEPFQAAFLRDVFAGASVCWLVVPEANAKTTLVAGLALYHIEHRPGAYVPVAASSRDQAEWIYRQAQGFVARGEHWDTFRCLEGYRRIRCDAQGSRIQVFAADDRSGDGIIATLAILDELHRHRDLALYRTWLGKLQKRGAQLVVISTAGEVGSEFETERIALRQEARDVTRRGAFTRAARPGAALHEWALPPDGDCEDLAQVKAANPLRAVTRKSLVAKRALPGMTVTHWLRFTCNRAARPESAAINESEWEAAETDETIPPGEPIWLGLDVAWKWDTTALVPLYWRDAEYRLLGPATILEPPRDGTSLDPHKIEAALIALHTVNPLHTVVMDMTRAEQLAEWISAELGARVVDRSQGNMAAAEDYERFMDALRLGRLRHTGHPGLKNHTLNAVARMLPGGRARFDRPAMISGRRSVEQERRVVDALIAAAMVHSIAAQLSGAPTPSPVSWRPL